MLPSILGIHLPVVPHGRTGIQPDEHIRILPYADDKALIAESEENLQYMLDLLGAWCHEWGIIINRKAKRVKLFTLGTRQCQKLLFNSLAATWSSGWSLSTVILVYG